MFLQAVPSTNWATNADPKSMVPVGPEAMAMLSNNIVICYNFKTEAKLYFKADNAQTCAGISLLAGHVRYPLFAVCEAVLRPRIFIIRYPDLEKLCTFYDPNILLYVDIAFSDYRYFVTLGDYPQYVMTVWNYYTAEKLASRKTYKKSSRYSLSCIKAEFEVIIQYSNWHNQIFISEVCSDYSSKESLVELSTIDLSSHFLLSDFCPVTYFEESMAYIVNDLGELYWIDVAQMALRQAWSTPKSQPCRHSLFYNKNGLIILNSKEIYFIKKKSGYAREWDLEWTLENTNGDIKKIISDYNNNIHLSKKYGNISRVQYVDKVVTLIPELSTHCYVMDYAFPKGIKDEVVLILNNNGDLRILDLIRMNNYSKLHYDDAISLAAHNALPIIACGTKSGLVHFINYEKVRMPVELSSVHIGDDAIKQICLFDRCAFVRDELNGFHIYWNDYKGKHFQCKASLVHESAKNWNLLNMLLVDEENSMIFLNQEENPSTAYANEVWVYTWAANTLNVICTEFELPYKYKYFTVLQSGSTESIEFMGVRFHTNIIDSFLFAKNTIGIAYSLKTTHLTNIDRIFGNRNILTADMQGLVLHFRTHKKSKNTYGISRALLCNFVPNAITKMDECFNIKFLVVLDLYGCLTSYRLPMLTDCLRENKFETDYSKHKARPHKTEEKKVLDSKVEVIQKIPEKDLNIKDSLLDELELIAKATTELINFDTAVIGLDHMNYQKFCLNNKWHAMLVEESRTLCDLERKKLLDAITDQSRIRDWIFDLIKSKSTVFSTKLRSIFSTIFVESYSTRSSTKALLDRFDLFRFYEMEPLEDDLEVEEEVPPEDMDEEDEEGEEKVERIVARKALKRYVVEKGAKVYDHVMAKDFELQDTNLVTFNQMYNEEAKQTIILTDALKAEFNKNFILSKNFKDETMHNVLLTNATLEKIYSNMNCMLCLLKMDLFQAPALTVPEWERDENITKILTVDDSEITAINRRKKVVAAVAHKSGRMLLWSNEFWHRALIIMMDGVLEKLWEEEIKKTPPPPEFMSKKHEHDYNLEEQRALRQYLNTLQLLEEDRKKYLKILRDNEVKTYNLKKHFVVKLNEHITEINIQKMKYDFAIKHERIRLLNIKLTNFKRIDCKKKINRYREEATLLNKYIQKYDKLIEYLENEKNEYKVRYETQLTRDRQLDRQFKGQYLNSIPQQFQPDMKIIYRKRPKLPNKYFNSTEVCFEVGRHLVSKKKSKFPLSPDLNEFLNFMKNLDSTENCPNLMDTKYWDGFIKLRRQKLESELRLKGIQYFLNEIPKAISFLTDENRKLKDNHAERNSSLTLTAEEYFDVVHNQKLELVLTMGQVEIKLRNGNLEILRNAILMHVDDIQQINSLIKDAGLQKIKAMQGVARFRRQIIYKEWEHKVVRSNIEYLRYILQLVERCKITYEFLETLRNWHRVNELKATTTRVGLIEEIIEQKLNAARKQLDRLDKRMDDIREYLESKKRENRVINTQIDNIKCDVTFLSLNRDILGEEKIERVNNLRMGKAMQYGSLAGKVRADYVKILELSTILEITRLQRYDTLPPVVPECITLD